jgi:hypothetical protein
VGVAFNDRRPFLLICFSSHILPLIALAGFRRKDENVTLESVAKYEGLLEMVSKPCK